MVMLFVTLKYTFIILNFFSLMPSAILDTPKVIYIKQLYILAFYN